MQNPGEELLVSLSSPEGSSTGQGIVREELVRAKARGLEITVIVDVVAASGGYLIASVADNIYAAPRATIGSIGVIMQIHDESALLARKGLSVETYASSPAKSMLHTNITRTEEQKVLIKSKVEVLHSAFCDMVIEYRPGLDPVEVCNGEDWTGTQALLNGEVK